MNNFIFFIFSYLIGLLSVFLTESHFVYYYFGLILYLLIVLNFKEINKRLIYEPMVLSFVSAMIFMYLNQNNLLHFLMIASILFYLVALHTLKGNETKIRKIINEDFVHTFIVEKFFPILLPIAFLFLFLLLFGKVIFTTLLFILFYFLIVEFYTSNLKTQIGWLFYSLSQIFVFTYLSRFLELIDNKNLILIISIIVVYSLIKLINNGGRLLFFNHFKIFWKRNIGIKKQ